MLTPEVDPNNQLKHTLPSPNTYLLRRLLYPDSTESVHSVNKVLLLDISSLWSKRSWSHSMLMLLKHCAISVRSPKQSRPPLLGAGLSHFLSLLRQPMPHEAEQGDHSLQSLHLPSCGKEHGGISAQNAAARSCPTHTLPAT